MSKLHLYIQFINGRLVCLCGVGKYYYSGGFPICMAVEQLDIHGIECSMYHIADECLKNGWAPKTVYLRLTEDYIGTVSKDELYKYCYSSYTTQREMIFKYLFGFSSTQLMERCNTDKEELMKFLTPFLSMLTYDRH